MIVKITKNITCTNWAACSDSIVTKLESKYPGLHADNKNSKVKGHVSISHDQGKHQIWIALYEKEGIHEGMAHGKKVTQKSNRVEKYTDQIPTKKDLEDIL